MDLNASDGVQIGVGVVLTLTLGAVLWYACEARKQAKASVKISEANLRPVILLWIDAISLSELTGSPMKLNYWNIGNGPAVNIKLEVQPAIGDWEETPERVGMGVHDVKACISYRVTGGVPQEGLSAVARYEDVFSQECSTKLHVLVRDGELHNGSSQFLPCQ